ncbi:ATP-dependent helicase [Streptococcus equinus]|uniref:ATP-dependent helicase n=1 Tax=Streptococcus equinus TaxID=1335 RepID=UPI003B5A4E8A
MSTTTYIEKLSRIEKDEYQKAAFDSQCNTVVLAGPGSGKTTVLTLKAMHLLNDVITEPRGLACLTYSREAAREFTERLKELGLVRKNNIFLGTVHSFCLTEILGKFSGVYSLNIPMPIRIASEKQRTMLFEKAKKNVGCSDKYFKIERMNCTRMLSISGVSNICIDRDEAAEVIANEYEELLKQAGLIDYETIIIESTKLLQEKPYVRECISAKYPWLLIDEYQDLGRPLHEMVLSLIDNTNIKFFAVGDPDQSIYGFQGAVPDYLLELSERMDVLKITLVNNYRSNQDIIDGSELVLNQQRGYVAKTRENENAVYKFIEVNEELDDQIEYFVKRIIPALLEKHIPYEEIAVLVGNNSECNSIAFSCQKENIPYYIVKHQFNRSDFVKWVENCASWIEGDRDILFADLGDFWISLITVNGEIYLTDDEKLIIRERLYNVLMNSKVYEKSLIEWFGFIREKLCFDKHFEQNMYFQDEKDNIDNLVKEMSGSEYVGYGIDKFSKIGKPENQIVISTRHSSKGLEFEAIVMMGMEEDRFPNHYIKKDTRLLEEANRLCFVCVSRAKRVCILMRSSYYTIETKYGPWRKPYYPSRYWKQLYSRYGNIKIKYRD